MRQIPNRPRFRLERLRRRVNPVVLLAALTLSLIGCGSADDGFAETTSAQSTSGETERQEAADEGRPDRSAAPAQDEVINSVDPNPSEADVAPEIVLSVNDKGETLTYRGWAVLIEASLMHPDLFTPAASDAPIVLEPQFQ